MKTKPTDFERETILRMRADKCSAPEIAKALGLTKSQVDHRIGWLIQQGILTKFEEGTSTARQRDERDRLDEIRIAIFQAVRNDATGPRTTEAIAKETEIPIEVVREQLNQMNRKLVRFRDGVWSERIIESSKPVKYAKRR